MKKFNQIMSELFIGAIFLFAFVWIQAAFSAPSKPPKEIIPAIPASNASLDTLKNLAVGNSCATYGWGNRGKAPAGYLKGVALTFAKAICQSPRSDVMVVSKARSLPESSADLYDAFSWYHSNFSRLGMSNDQPGLDNLRHAYTLLIGLGMQESSGNYCTGRDLSAGFSSADTAEAGAWQASYGARVKSPELGKLFIKYKTSSAGCYLEVFKQGAACKASDAKNWGNGDGAIYQQLAKVCPAFAAEYAAVLLRVSGGTRGEFGPLRRKAAEIRPECDSMLKQIQDSVSKNPDLCKAL